MEGESLAELYFPRDMWAAGERLCDTEFRLSAGVHPQNPYMFATTHNAHFAHVSGDYALNQMFAKAGLDQPDMCYFTQNRHLVSTDFVGLEVPDEAMSHFFESMGHQKATSKSRYQCPRAVESLVQVATRLQGLEGKNLIDWLLMQMTIR